MSLEQLAEQHPNDQELGKEVRKYIKSPVVDGKRFIDSINAQTLIDFLEYEEALTKDKESAWRIRKLLKSLGLWN